MSGSPRGDGETRLARDEPVRLSNERAESQQQQAHSLLPLFLRP